MKYLGVLETKIRHVLQQLGLLTSTGTNAAVIGPASATDRQVMVADGATGKLVAASPTTIDANGTVTIPVGEALRIGTGTSGVRLEVNSGELSVREGDDSASAPLSASAFTAVSGTSTLNNVRQASNGDWALVSSNGGLQLASDNAIGFSSTTAYTGTLDVGLTRGAAGVVEVTDGSTGDGAIQAGGGFRLTDGGATAVNHSGESIILRASSGNRVTINGTNVTTAIPIVTPDGSAAAPAITGSDTDSGVFFNGVNNVSIATSGLQVGGYSTTGFSHSLGVTGAGQPTATFTHATQTVTLSGATTATTNLIPAGATVFGVTYRVTTTVTGATSFDVGDGSDGDRYGDDIALTAGTTGDETAWTADPRWWATGAREITFTANGSNFTGGVVRIHAYYLVFTPPGA